MSTEPRLITDESRALDWWPFDGDQTDCLTLSDKVVTGRKPHVCQHCGGPIFQGERHRAIGELDREEGAMSTHRFCPDCLNAHQLEDDGDTSWPFEKRMQRFIGEM